MSRKESPKRFRALALRLRGVRTLALVGRSGTGKSFRAHLVADRHGVDVIIDDGLIIQDRTILYGQSAKTEKTVISAVRRALFEQPGAGARARQILRAARFHKVLIIGTSEEMAVRIADNLWLPRPSEVFRIEEVASAREMDAAQSRRKKKGRHFLPLPPAKVRLSLRGALASRAQALAASVAALAGRRPALPDPMMESADQARGDVVFTESAIGQMVQHCIQEYDRGLLLGKVVLGRRGSFHLVEVRIKEPFQYMTSGRLQELREYISRSLEKYAGILTEVSLVVETIEARDPSAQG
jgi:hypothetical protein